jgi:hypothetical protein
MTFVTTPHGISFFLDAPRACPVCHTAHLWMKRTWDQRTLCLDCYGEEHPYDTHL